MSKKIKDENGKVYVQKKPIYKRPWFIIIAVVILLGIIGNLNKGDDTSTNQAKTNQAQEKVKNENNENKENEKNEEITYEKVESDKMVEDLDNNALNAEKTYNGKYFEIHGKLSNIDSSGKYIVLTTFNNDFNLTNIQCYIKNEDQKNKVAELNKDQEIVIKGKVTNVGEVLGYSVDIDEIIAD